MAGAAPPAVEEPTEAALSVVVDRVRRVPDRYREFVQDERRAAWEHQISRPLLGRLTDLGLPCAKTRGGWLYDRLDLTNTALNLRLPTARAMAMRGWANSLVAAARAASTVFEIHVEARCPSPGHSGECAYELSDTLRTLPGFTPDSEGHRCGLRRRIERPEPSHQEGLRELAALARPLRYHLLPEDLRADLGFLAETGLADCGLAALFLTHEARNMGLASRCAFGFFIAVPYSMEHSWTEVRDGGTWTAIDPHLVNLLTDWSFLSPSLWPPHRSIGACTWRIADEDPNLITHHGAPTFLSLATNRAQEDPYP
ncbi:transglutaminase domain-containing protein [Streptosporangium sp. NPDC004631]